MADKTGDETQREHDEGPTKRPYVRPVLIKLGTLRDITMTVQGGGAPDGRPNRGTKRGGDFETCRT